MNKMLTKYRFTKQIEEVIKIEDIYGNKYPIIPTYYTIEAFRVPLPGEIYLLPGVAQTSVLHSTPCGGTIKEPRLILKCLSQLGEVRRIKTICVDIKPSDVYKIKPKIPAGYQIIDFRPPTSNELFINSLGITYRLREEHCSYFKEDTPRYILTKTVNDEPDWWF